MQCARGADLVCLSICMGGPLPTISTTITSSHHGSTDIT
jgi:hypothetical protein